MNVRYTDGPAFKGMRLSKLQPKIIIKLSIEKLKFLLKSGYIAFINIYRKNRDSSEEKDPTKYLESASGKIVICSKRKSGKSQIREPPKKYIMSNFCFLVAAEQMI